MKIVTKNSEETKKVGQDLAEKIENGTTILLYGELGAGKTTFVQGFAKGLGIKDRILSPTFVLQRIHDVEKGKIKRLNHLDLYRIETPIEIKNLGVEELFDEPESITLIEWADRLLNFKPKNGYKINFKNLEDTEREIEINAI
jgi:tRNA threonylcarbamoyladenosine biosynthesis protein TsaE